MTTPDTKAIRENMKALDGVTPGPWYVNGPKKMEIVGRIHSVLNPENYPAAFVPAWDQPMAGEVDGKDEAIANARLIAAAPDMRETILALCDALDKLRADIETCTAKRDEWADRAMTDLGNVLDLRAEIERLRAALAFYTVSDNWCIGGPLDGNSPSYTGGPARAALGQDGDV